MYFFSWEFLIRWIDLLIDRSWLSGVVVLIGEFRRTIDASSTRVDFENADYSSVSVLILETRADASV